MQTSESRSSYGYLWSLLRLAKPSGWLLAVTAMLALASVANTLAFPVLTKHLVDEIGRSVPTRGVAALLATVMLGSALASFVSSYLLSRIGHEMIAASRTIMPRTNIIVSHRLSTVVHADRIYFLEAGQISGCGTHDELMRSHPQYARLVARQFRMPVQDRERDASVGAGPSSRLLSAIGP